MAMEFDGLIMMDSQWEYTDYEPNNIHIYEKEFHDYVVYYVAQGDSRLFSGSSQHSSYTGIRRMWENIFNVARSTFKNEYKVSSVNYAFLVYVRAK